MPLDGTYPLSSSILKPIKEKVEELMKAFKDPTDTNFVWKDVIGAESWYQHNTMSVSWKRYPVVFFVVSRVRPEPGAINYQRKWTVELQIEFNPLNELYTISSPAPDPTLLAYDCILNSSSTTTGNSCGIVDTDRSDFYIREYYTNI